MPLISFAKALQRITNRQVDPLYLIFGEEPYLLQEYTTTCIDRMLGSAPRDFNCDVLTATSETLPEALSLAHTLPMMATHRVVVLHEINQLRKAERHALETYAEQPSETTALICTTMEPEPRKLLPQFWHHAVAIECKRLEGSQLRNWVTRSVEEQGNTITAEAVHGFLRDQQNDLWTLKREIEKLCTYAGDKQAISLAEVQEVCQPIQMHSIFALTDAVGMRQIGQAFSVIDGLLHQGEPPLVIFSMIVRHLRLLWSLKELVGKGENANDSAKTLRLPMRVCRQLASQCRQFSGQRLHQLYTMALEADVAFKTTNKPPKAVLEDLILTLCTEP